MVVGQRSQLLLGCIGQSRVAEAEVAAPQAGQGVDELVAIWERGGSGSSSSSSSSIIIIIIIIIIMPIMLIDTILDRPRFHSSPQVSLSFASRLLSSYPSPTGRGAGRAPMSAAEADGRVRREPSWPASRRDPEREARISRPASDITVGEGQPRLWIQSSVVIIHRRLPFPSIIIIIITTTVCLLFVLFSLLCFGSSPRRITMPAVHPASLIAPPMSQLRPRARPLLAAAGGDHRGPDRGRSGAASGGSGGSGGAAVPTQPLIAISSAAIALCYADRSNISTCIVPMAAELHWSLPFQVRAMVASRDKCSVGVAISTRW